MAGANLAGPVGMLTYVIAEIHPILQTVSVALSDFPGSDGILHKLKGVRFIFDRTTSDRAFQIRNAMLKLYAGGKSISTSRHPNEDMTRAVFTLDEKEYASIRDGSVASVRYASSSSELAVQVGKIVKPR